MISKKIQTTIKLIFKENVINSFSLIFFYISLVLVFLGIFYHPYVGDDYYFKEIVLNNQNLFEYFEERYLNWTGRISQILLSFWIFSGEINLYTFKFLLIPIILFLFLKFLKNIINLKISFLSENFIILFISFWFIYPAINETVFWLSGSIVYLMSLFFAVLYLSLFNLKKNYDLDNIFTFIFFIILSFLTGSSHLQVFVGCLVVSTFYIIHFFKKKDIRFQKLKIFYFSFIIGGIILIIAPGNYNRLVDLETSSLISIIYKSFIFIFTSVFYLGDIQSSLVFFLIIALLVFLFSKKISLKLLFNKFNFIWFIAFLFSLIAVIPAINSATTRLIFFPIFFLSVYFLKVIFNNYDLNKKKQFKNLTLFLLVILFFIETLLGSLTNYAYKIENKKRMQIIENTKKNSENLAIIKHYTLIPSRLTYMQTPEHDKEFLSAISKVYNIEIKYAEELPRSRNIRKEIKFFFK